MLLVKHNYVVAHNNVCSLVIKIYLLQCVWK
jgi:hypothetical protein